MANPGNVGNPVHSAVPAPGGPASGPVVNEEADKLAAANNAEAARRKAENDRFAARTKAAREEWAERNLGSFSWFNKRENDPSLTANSTPTLSNGGKVEPLRAGLYHLPGSDMDILVEKKADGGFTAKPILSKDKGYFFTTVAPIPFEKKNGELLDFYKKHGLDVITLSWDRPEYATIKVIRRFIKLAQERGLRLVISDATLASIGTTPAKRQQIMMELAVLDQNSFATKLQAASKLSWTDSSAVEEYDVKKRLSGKDRAEREAHFNQAFKGENGVDKPLADKIKILHSIVNTLTARREKIHSVLNSIDTELKANDALLDKKQDDRGIELDPQSIPLVVQGALEGEQRNMSIRLDDLQAELRDVEEQERLVEEKVNAMDPAGAQNEALVKLKASWEKHKTDQAGKDANAELNQIDAAYQTLKERVEEVKRTVSMGRRRP